MLYSLFLSSFPIISFSPPPPSLQGVERELVASGVIEVRDNIISLNPNVNG